MRHVVIVALVDLPSRRLAAGDVATVGPRVARTLVERGHAKRLDDAADDPTYATRMLTPAPHVRARMRTS